MFVDILPQLLPSLRRGGRACGGRGGRVVDVTEWNCDWRMQWVSVLGCLVANAVVVGERGSRRMWRA